MKSIIKVALFGLTTGVIIGGVPALHAACGLGCQMSTAWASKWQNGTPAFCVIFNNQHARDGRVNPDIGTLTVIDEKVDKTPCPYADCDQACPSGFNVPHQSFSNGVHQGCGQTQQDDRYYCEAP